jgi:G:T/U-mismatch repair DNA glycosylase
MPDLKRLRELSEKHRELTVRLAEVCEVMDALPSLLDELDRLTKENESCACTYCGRHIPHCDCVDTAEKKIQSLRNRIAELEKNTGCWVSQESAPTNAAFERAEKAVRFYRDKLQEKAEQIAHRDNPRTSQFVPMVMVRDIEQAIHELNAAVDQAR